MKTHTLCHSINGDPCMAAPGVSLMRSLLWHRHANCELTMHSSCLPNYQSMVVICSFRFTAPPPLCRIIEVWTFGFVLFISSPHYIIPWQSYIIHFWCYTEFVPLTDVIERLSSVRRMYWETIWVRRYYNDSRPYSPLIYTHPNSSKPVGITFLWHI